MVAVNDIAVLSAAHSSIVGVLGDEEQQLQDEGQGRGVTLASSQARQQTSLRGSAIKCLALVFCFVLAAFFPTFEEPEPRSRRATVEVFAKREEETTFVETVESVHIPNVLQIGGQKCGSSALARWMHWQGVCAGQVFEGEPEHFAKEIHFFDFPNRYDQGVDFYARRFDHCFAEQDALKTADGRTLLMDATPRTLLFPDKVRPIYDQAGGNLAKDVKIIVVLRDPISRALSLYNHKRYELRENGHGLWVEDVAHPNGTLKTFDEYIDSVHIPRLEKFSGIIKRAEEESNILNVHIDEPAFYAFHLRRWFEFFRREQILVLGNDEMSSDPQTLQWRVKEFLQANFTLSDAFPHTNSRKNDPGKVRKVSCAVEKRLQKFYEPFNEELYKLLEETEGRPSMEQHPFPKFALSPCDNSEEAEGVVSI